jgi:hypothetical protein
MTVSSSTDRATFAGNGVATVFPLPFRFFVNGDVQASLIAAATGAVTPLTLGVHYTLIGASLPEQDGNSESVLTMFVAPVIGVSLFVLRVIPLTQPTDIVNQGRFFPETHEDVFDRLTMLLQQNSGSFNRALRVQDYDPVPARLPGVAQRFNRILSFDAVGNPVAIDAAADSSLVLRQDLASPSGAGYVGFGTETVESVLTSLKSGTLYITDPPYSVAGNNTPADRLNLIAALDAAAAAGKVVVVPAKVYQFNDWIPLPDNLKMVFEPGAEWKLSAETALGGFVCGGYTSALVPRPFTNVEIYGISLDCNSVAGENGFNAINASNVKVYSPKIKNTLFSTVKLGGRAFQFEGAVVDGVHVYSPYIENCTVGINSQGDPSGGAEIARNINYYDVVMRNVDVPFNVDGQFASPQTGTLVNSSVFVHGAQLFNCGKLTFPGASSTTGGGIICGDRGYGLSISGLRVVNAPVYGGIGALVRGVVFNFRLSDVHMDVPSCAAVFDHSATGFGAPSLADFPALVYADGVRFKGGLDYVIKAGGAAGRVGSGKYEVEINGAVATLTGITDAAGITGAYLNLSLTDSGFKESGLRSLSDLHTAGNSTGVCIQQYTEGSWTPIDASGAALSFTAVSGSYVKNGRVVTAAFKLDYPATASTAAAIIGGLPFTAINLQVAGSLSISYKSASQLFSGNPAPNTQTVGLFTSAGVTTKNNEMASTTLIGTVTYIAAS